MSRESDYIMNQISQAPENFSGDEGSFISDRVQNAPEGYGSRDEMRGLYSTGTKEGDEAFNKWLDKNFDFEKDAPFIRKMLKSIIPSSGMVFLQDKETGDKKMEFLYAGGDKEELEEMQTFIKYIKAMKKGLHAGYFDTKGDANPFMEGLPAGDTMKPDNFSE